MKAVFTLTFWAEVEDSDEATTMAIDAEKAARVNMLAVIDQKGAEESDLEGKLGLLGINFWLIDEEKVLG